MNPRRVMNRDTCVIIPVYNEAAVIRGVVESVLERFDHVVCVDDGCRDDSAAEVRRTKARLVRHPINLGQGAALQTGIEYALLNPDIKYFITFDADGQHRLDDAEAMLKAIREGKHNIVLGSRFLKRGTKLTRPKRAVLWLATRFMNATSGVRLTDSHNGLRVFDRHVAETLNITMPDMSHASEIVHKIAQNEYGFIEVPVTIDYTEYSMQKGQSIINGVNILFDMLLMGRRKSK
jgi:polyprenyl-phospho-N-acetylgalactosaminyl synthase